MYLSVPVPRTLSSWQCLHSQGSASGCNWIFLDNNHLDIVFSAEFLPIWMRGKSMQHAQIVDFRILTGDSKMGPIMAFYGISLDFSMSTLASVWPDHRVRGKVSPHHGLWLWYHFAIGPCLCLQGSWKLLHSGTRLPPFFENCSRHVRCKRSHDDACQPRCNVEGAPGAGPSVPAVQDYRSGP